jgi:hypothetical protein
VRIDAAGADGMAVLGHGKVEPVGIDLAELSDAG